MLVNIENVSKSFGGQSVLENISGQIHERHRIGLVGANGAGKSTLLNLIVGDLEPDTGKVFRGSGKNFGFLRQNSGLQMENTIHQEMRQVFAHLIEMQQTMAEDEIAMSKINPESKEYDEISSRYATMQGQFELSEGYQIEAKIATVLNGMGFKNTDWNTKVGVLSGGEGTRLAICKLLLEEPDLLILDEPTNHLDFPTLLWLEDYLDDYKGGLLIVSHDRYFLNRLCDNIWEVENQQLFTYPGNYTQYLTLKEDRITFQQKQYELQQQEIAAAEDFIARNIVRASTTGRAQSRRRALERMELIPKPKAPPRPPQIYFSPNREPVNDVLHVEGLALSVDEPPNQLFSDVDLTVMRGEKIAIVGHNGIGKSSMLKALLKKIPYDDGRIQWGRNTDITYFEQGESELDPEKTVIQQLWDSYPMEVEHTIRSVLGSAGFSGDSVFKQVKHLSGGEKARIKFANLMLAGGNVIIMDEPSNHLDLPTKEVLDSALEKYTGTLLVVSHDRYLLNKFPDKIAEMHEDCIVIYDGKYDDYAAIIDEQKQAAAAEKEQQRKLQAQEAKKSSSSNAYRTREDRQRAAYRRQKLTQLESAIKELEKEIEELQFRATQPEIMSDYAQLEEIYSTLEGNQKLLNEKVSKWAKLGEEELADS